MASAPLTAWSYSRLSKWEQCPAAAKYRNIDKLPEPQSEPMRRGDLIHKDIAAWLISEAPGAPAWTLTTAAGLAPPRAINAFEGTFTDLKASKGLLVEQQWGFTRKWSPTGWFGKDTWYRSIIDAGVIAGDTMLVGDHKTGKPYGTNEEQMEQFALAAFARYPVVAEVDTRLWYLDTAAEQAMTFAKKDEPLLRTKWEKRVAPMLADTTFAPRPSQACRFCHFRRSNGGPCQFS